MNGREGAAFADRNSRANNGLDLFQAAFFIGTPDANYHIRYPTIESKGAKLIHRRCEDVARHVCMYFVAAPALLPPLPFARAPCANSQSQLWLPLERPLV